LRRLTPIEKAQAASPGQRQRGAPAAVTNDTIGGSDLADGVPPLRYRSAQAGSAGPANGPIVALSGELGGRPKAYFL